MAVKRGCGWIQGTLSPGISSLDCLLGGGGQATLEEGVTSVGAAGGGWPGGRWP